MKRLTMAVPLLVPPRELQLPQLQPSSKKPLADRSKVCRILRLSQEEKIMKFILPIFAVMALSACDDKEDDTAADTAATVEDTAVE